MMKGLWLLPSRGRPDALKRFFDAALGTGMRTGGLVILHRDDCDGLKDVYEAYTLPDGWQYRISDAEGFAATIQEVWASGDLNELDWIGILSDDAVPETPQWDARLITRIDRHNIVGANDGWQSPKKLVFAVFSRELISSVGFFAPPGMHHMFFDDIWETLGRDTGCITWALDVMIRHNHASKTGRSDATTEKVNSFWSEDESTYRVWRQTDRKRAGDAIFSLVENHGVKVFHPNLEKSSVLLAMLSHDGKYEAEFMRSLIATKDVLEQVNAKLEIAELNYCADLGLARARLFGSFLRSNHTNMLMIDADMGWQPQDVLRLFEHEYDFVCAAGPKKKYPLEFAFESVTAENKPKPMRSSPDGMSFEITGAGMAFTMISKACAEQMAAAYPQLQFEVDNGVVEYGVFDPFYDGKKRCSEDYSFCRRWSAIGGKIHLLPHIRLKHVGSHTFEGCLLDDIIAKAGRQAA